MLQRDYRDFCKKIVEKIVYSRSLLTFAIVLWRQMAICSINFLSIPWAHLHSFSLAHFTGRGLGHHQNHQISLWMCSAINISSHNNEELFHSFCKHDQVDERWQCQTSNYSQSWSLSWTFRSGWDWNCSLNHCDIWG